MKTDTNKQGRIRSFINKNDIGFEEVGLYLMIGLGTIMVVGFIIWAAIWTAIVVAGNFAAVAQVVGIALAAISACIVVGFFVNKLVDRHL